MFLSLNKRTVFAVRGIKEVEEIFNALEPFTFNKFFKILFVRIYVSFINLLLRFIKLCLFAREKNISNIKHIVVYTVGILGDNVVIIPALSRLRDQFPLASITLVTNCQEWDSSIAAGLLDPSRFKDKLILLNDDPVLRKGLKFIITDNSLSDMGCDLFVNLSPFGNRGWFGAVVREIAFARLIKAKYAVGFAISTLSRGKVFNDVQYIFVKNEPRRYIEILQSLNISSTSPEDLLEHCLKSKTSVIDKLKKCGVDPDNFFIVNPGAKFMTKCWPADRFGNVASKIYSHFGGKVIVTGTSAETDIADSVVSFSADSAISFAGMTTLQELIELIRLAKGCITNDTGTMHLASMIGIPTVAIFSLRHSTTHWLPLGDNVVSLFSLPSCRYCYNDSCVTRECLLHIEVEDIYKQVLAIFPNRY